MSRRLGTLNTPFPLPAPPALAPQVPQRCWRKLIVPIEKYPGYNFFGAIIGPRGNAQKRMERESGCKIVIRGKGAIKDGCARHDGKPLGPEDEEPMHVLIEGCVRVGFGRSDPPTPYAARWRRSVAPCPCLTRQARRGERREGAGARGGCPQPVRSRRGNGCLAGLARWLPIGWPLHRTRCRTRARLPVAFCCPCPHPHAHACRYSDDAISQKEQQMRELAQARASPGWEHAMPRATA